MADLRDKLAPRLDDLVGQHEQLERQLGDPEVLADHHRIRQLNARRAAIDDLVTRWREIRSIEAQIAEHEQLIAEDVDAELAALAREELPGLRGEVERSLEAIASELVTADEATVGSVILEVRAAAGGAEAALWAGELLQLYKSYAAARGWSFEDLGFAEGEQGGVRHATAQLTGERVWQRLGYESGVHCVKRVPATEAQGRIHTSTATVAVLPEPETVDIDIPDGEVKVYVTTAQGPGGQNVNKVATAVHMVHEPTGIEVRMQESKSQAQNRAKAHALLRARVFDYYQKQKDAERAESRAAMIGSGERSERIRTYRFKDNLAVDHRLGATFNLDRVLAGDLDPLIDALLAEDRARRLAAL